jgi:hypothetical protein
VNGDDHKGVQGNMGSQVGPHRFMNVEHQATLFAKVAT